MKVLLWSVGKSHEPYIKAGVEDFTKRIGNYYPAQWTIIPPVKNAASLSAHDLKKKEADIILALLQKDDYLVALDERGGHWPPRVWPNLFSHGLTKAPGTLFF